MAKSAEDCALMMNVMAGFDARDSTSLNHPKEDYTRALNAPLSGLKIGLPREYFAEGLDANVAKVIEAALAEYKKLGAIVVDISLPNSKLSIPVYYVLAPAEASSNLSRYDGVRYGHRAAEYTDLMDMYMKSRAEGFGAEVKRRILIGTYVLSAGYYDAYYKQAQRVRALLHDIPLENIVVETDAPDIPPSFLGTMGSTARNSPVFLPRIAALLASVRGIAVESFAAATTDNVRRIIGAK